ncbi:MAG: hypothetical protein EOO90_21660 [Pedobacter sp.]|nr:MAG: hypothetical protein EOO90_21660 [Pedobacter sp.]
MCKTNQEIESFLTNKSESLSLKAMALASLEKIFSNNTMEQLDLNGLDRTRIRQIFERFEYHLGNSISIIKTRFALYHEIDNGTSIKSNPIGYYELETNFDGEFSDEYFVIY